VISNILHNLIINELNLYVTDLNIPYTFIINITNDIAKINDSSYFEFTKNQDNNTTYHNCPVCYNDYTMDNKIRLKCGHYICITCFIEIIKTKTYSCPCCRQIFI